MIMAKTGLMVITDIFSPIRGGTAVWFDEVYRRLGGKEIHVVTGQTAGSSEIDQSHPNTIHRVELRHSTWMRPYSLPIYLNLLVKCLGVASRIKFRAVHAGKVLPEGLVGWVIARLFGKCLVIYAHGEEITTWRNTKRLYPMRFVYRRANIIIANSEFTKTELVNLGVDSERIKIIFPGVNLARFHPDNVKKGLRESIGISNEQKLIFSVGRLNLRKGFDQVIRVLSSLRDHDLDAHYAIAGKGEAMEQLVALAREQNVADRVHFLGAVPDNDLPGWYNACDVFAMPNREINGDTEGFGMVFLEAAACGKAVVAGLAGGTGAAVEDGVTGLRVDGKSTEEIRIALHNLLKDKSFSQHLGEAGLSRARESFGWEAVASNTLSVLKC